MGAKDSVKFKLRRPAFKCDMCPKKFLSSQAMASHIIFVHKTKSKGKVRQPNDLNNLLGKSVKTIDAAKKSVEESDLILEVEPAQVSDVRKIEYECPQCFQCFAVYFSAFRHIQKNHCINSNGVKVPLNSLEIIKPVRIEVCMKCNQRLRPNDTHSCSDVNTNIDLMASYMCSGCKQQFTSLKLFDMHVMGLHCDELETLFFPSKDEFTLWKEDVESQAKVKYLILDKKSNKKQIYHCTYLASTDSDEDNVVHFCPSSIFVRDFTKSIQVHFYKQHFDHESKYKLPEIFNKYRIKELLKLPTPITEPFELRSLQVDFKTLMNFLIIESTKCDKQTLDVLHQKAQDMLTVVNTTEEPSNTNKRNMTDDQITETLETLDAKKMKTDTKCDIPVAEDVVNTNQYSTIGAPVILNAFSLAPDKKMKRNVRVKQKEAIPPPVSFVMNSSPCSSKSSFNDSYREFVDKNFKAVLESDAEKNANKIEEKSDEKKSKPSLPVQKTISKPNILKNKKKIVKTKIGQFKPNLSPKKTQDIDVKDPSCVEKVLGPLPKKSENVIVKDGSSVVKVQSPLPKKSENEIVKNRSRVEKVPSPLPKKSENEIIKNRSRVEKVQSPLPKKSENEIVKNRSRVEKVPSPLPKKSENEIIKNRSRVEKVQSPLPKKSENEIVKNRSRVEKVPSPLPKKSENEIVKTRKTSLNKTPTLSPKKFENRRSSIGKVDFVYEVREQENDCNILVLKF